MIAIREARDTDTPGIIAIYRATYGEEYAYPQYYDEYEIKKLVFSDETLILVAEDAETGQVVGTASVILEVGAYTDLVGEFGRLAVHPDYRRRGIGTELLTRRIETVRDRVHVGVIEGRVTHPFTQAIAQQQGFAPVGFLPLKFVFGDRRESMGFLVRLFGRALELRRNNPRIVPEVYHLACTALENCGLEPDVIVDDESGAYPFGHGFSVSELTTEGYSRLMRIERGRVRNREVFGPLRLQYGYFKLITHHSMYLVAREGDHIVGAIGFTREQIDCVVRAALPGRVERRLHGDRCQRARATHAAHDSAARLGSGGLRSGARIPRGGASRSGEIRPAVDPGRSRTRNAHPPHE